MPFGDEKDTTRGGTTFRVCCAEFGLHPADCRHGMRHVPRDVAKRFRDRWEALLYEGSGVPREPEARTLEPGRVMTPEGRAKRYGSVRPDAVLEVLPADPRFALSLNQINTRLKRAPTRDHDDLKRALVALQSDGLVAGTTAHKATTRRFASPRVRYFRAAA